MVLKPHEALKIMAEYDCEMSLPSLYAWMRSEKRPCPFGIYTQSNEDNLRGTYTIFKGRLLAWLQCRDMITAYGGKDAAGIYEQQ